MPWSRVSVPPATESGLSWPRRKSRRWSKRRGRRPPRPARVSRTWNSSGGLTCRAWPGPRPGEGGRHGDRARRGDEAGLRLARAEAGLVEAAGGLGAAVGLAARPGRAEHPDDDDRDHGDDHDRRPRPPAPGRGRCGAAPAVRRRPAGSGPARPPLARLDRPVPWPPPGGPPRRVAGRWPAGVPGAQRGQVPRVRLVPPGRPARPGAPPRAGPARRAGCSPSRLSTMDAGRRPQGRVAGQALGHRPRAGPRAATSRSAKVAGGRPMAANTIVWAQASMSAAGVAVP